MHAEYTLPGIVDSCNTKCKLWSYCYAFTQAYIQSKQACLITYIHYNLKQFTTVRHCYQ